METRQITLKRSIITPRYNTIPAGTVLDFDEEGATTIEDESIFLYRIHALCYDLTGNNKDNYILRHSRQVKFRSQFPKNQAV